MNAIIYLDVPVLIMKEEVYYHALNSIISNNIHIYICLKNYMCTNDITQLIQVCKFIEIVLKKLKQPPGNS